MNSHLTTADKIKKFEEIKKEIQRLSEEQDSLFAELINTLDPKDEEAKDWLFDMAFNRFNEFFEKEKLLQLLK